MRKVLNGADEDVAGERRPRARASWGSLSREHIVGAATEIVRAGGFDTMTIRSLARKLNVAPMTLYGHVRDKDDLLLEVVDRLLADKWETAVPKSDWRRWIASVADRLRKFLVSQPAALRVYLRGPVTVRSAIRRMEEMLSVLEQATGGSESAQRAYAAIHTYTVGFAALEASRSTTRRRGGVTDPLARQLGAYTSSRQFNEGLEYLLDGIASRAKSSTSFTRAARD
ncbi:MAG: TetR/AcrR family transcriptional regulator C-terminal domain-containing protein [Acidimicrobiales bacterium]